MSRPGRSRRLELAQQLEAIAAELRAEPDPTDRPQPKPGPPKLALSIPECAKAMAVSERQLYRMLDNEGLPSVHMGRRRVIPVRALEEWIARNTEKGYGVTLDNLEHQ